MKSKHRITTSLLILLTINTACTKVNPVITVPNTPVGPPPPPSGMLVGNKEYFWKNNWSRSPTGSGYELKLDTWRLSQAAITQGIQIEVTWNDMYPWTVIPYDFVDLDHRDSVHLSWVAIPGQLKIIAQAPFEVHYETGVGIEYR